MFRNDAEVWKHSAQHSNSSVLWSWLMWMHHKGALIFPHIASDYRTSSHLPLKNKNDLYTHFLSSNNHDLPHETTVTISQKEETGGDTWLYYMWISSTQLLEKKESLLNFPFHPLTINASSLDSSSFRVSE